MRHAAIVILLTALSATPFAHAKEMPTVADTGAEQDVLSLCRAYPSGGEGMAKKVTELLSGDPKLAADFARLSKSCNCDQAAAIALGVSRATAELQKTAASAIKPMYESLTGSCAPVTCPRQPYSRKRVDNPAPSASLASGEPAISSGTSAALATASLTKLRAPAARTVPATTATALSDVAPLALAKQSPAVRFQGGPSSANGADSGKAAFDAKLRAPRDDSCETLGGEQASASKRRQDDMLKVREPQGQDCFCALISSLATQAFAQGDAGERIGFFPDEGSFAGGGVTNGGAPVTSN